MKKPVKSVNSRLMVLLILVIGLAVAVLTIGRGQDTRSSAAGVTASASCSLRGPGCLNNGTVCGNYYTCKAYDPVRDSNIFCVSGKYACCETTNNSGNCIQYHCCGNGNGGGGNTTCGGTRGSCSGSCPKGQVCQAPNVKSNGDKCGCHPAPKPTKKK